MRFSLTAEQLEEARAERMRQNGHGAITFEDVRTWIEETGLCIFLPRSTQAGQNILAAPTATPTFVEAVAGQPVNEPSLELIATAEALLVRLEAEGVAVRLNLAGQPLSSTGDQPDYVVAGWVLPYIYALRGDRDWRRSPQLTGSRQVSQLAVQAAKHIDGANLTSTQIRDALGREVTEAAVLRALHELWKQLRIIPVVPELGQPALWQPLRQRFQKAIAEGASTSQVTAISVLASIYLQAVIAASMEDIEMFLSPLTSRSKIREVVRGLAATRQVHTTNMGHISMFYVAGTLPEFPAVPNFQVTSSTYMSSSSRSSSYRSSNYSHSYPGQTLDEDLQETLVEAASFSSTSSLAASIDAPESVAPVRHIQIAEAASPLHRASSSNGHTNGHSNGNGNGNGHSHEKQKEQAVAAPAHSEPATPAASFSKPAASKSAAPRPRPQRSAASAHPRERSRTAASGESRSSSERRRIPAPRAASNSRTSSGARNGSSVSKTQAPISKASKPTNGKSNGNGHSNGNGNGSHSGRPASKVTRAASNGNGHSSSKPAVRNGAGSKASGSKAPAPKGSGFKAHSAPKPVRNGASPASRNGKPAPKTAASPRPAPRSASSARAADKTGRKPEVSASKRYSFSGQAKQAPKPVAKRATAAVASRSAKPTAAAGTKKTAHHSGSKPVSRQGARHGSETKRRG
jgi:hypothetical protein